jgi:two-component system sensor histidine kinase BaeS
MLSDALSEQYAQHGNWRFLRNNDRFIFQILRSLERDNDDRSPPGHAMPDGGPPPDGRPRPDAAHGWRTMFWVAITRVLVGRASASGGRHPAQHVVGWVGSPRRWSA